MGNPIQFNQLLEGMDRCKLDAMHKEKLEARMVYDPKFASLAASAAST
jgi:hypothetical protein